jgi:hypothetical protein
MPAISGASQTILQSRRSFVHNFRSCVGVEPLCALHDWCGLRVRLCCTGLVATQHHATSLELCVNLSLCWSWWWCMGDDQGGWTGLVLILAK